MGRRIKQTDTRWKTEHIDPLVEMKTPRHHLEWDAYGSAASYDSARLDVVVVGANFE